jgi:UMF1 family MFS transporter
VGETPAGGRPGLLGRLALDRPELRAWALYDWANSGFYTVVVTEVFPIFFAGVVAAEVDPDARRRAFGIATTIALAVGAVLSPLLGALADVVRVKKLLLGASVVVGAGASASLAVLGAGDVTLALVLFALANLGAVSAFVFYDALLPHVARDGEADRLSTSAYALGYLGGGLVLAFSLLLVARPAWFGLPYGAGLTPDEASLPARLGFLLVGAWWLVFSLPLFLRVSEPPLGREPDPAGGPRPSAGTLAGLAVRQLAGTLRELGRYRHAAWMLAGFLVYNDGIGTIIRMATLYGEEKSIDRGLMIGAILGVQFVAIPATLGFGRLAERHGAKRAILAGLAVYVVICLVGYGLGTVGDSPRLVSALFLTMALLVGLVQGGCQALSRSLFASLIPRHMSGEFFGLFAALEKFAGVLGPAVFVLAPSTAQAVLWTVGFFAVGGLLLLRVDVEAGRAAARAAEAVRARERSEAALTGPGVEA